MTLEVQNTVVRKEGEKRVKITDRLIRAKNFTYGVVVPVCLVIMVLIMIVAWGESIYWRYGEFKPLILHLPNDNGNKISVLNADKTVCAGERMSYGFEFTKTMDVACTVKRQLVDGSVVLYEATDPPRKPLGRQAVVASIPIAKNIDKKEWFMRWTAECKVGPSDRIVPTTAVTEKFTVTDCDKPVVTVGKTGPQGPKGNPGKNFWGN